MQYYRILKIIKFKDCFLVVQYHKLPLHGWGYKNNQNICFPKIMSVLMNGFYTFLSLASSCWLFIFADLVSLLHSIFSWAVLQLNCYIPQTLYMCQTRNLLPFFSKFRQLFFLKKCLKITLIEIKRNKILVHSL